MAIAATFTAKPIEASLRFWLEQFHFLGGVSFGRINQVFEALLDPGSALNSNQGGINAVLVRIHDWVEASEPQKQALTADDWRQRLAAPVEEFIAAVRSRTQTTIPLIVTLCPCSPRLTRDQSVAAVFSDIERQIAQAVVVIPGAYVLTPGAIQENYAITDVSDLRSDELGCIPYTPMYFAAMGTMLARTALAIRRPPYKVIALDCDNTLWRGMCAQDSLADVSVEEPFRQLQRFMLTKSEEGKLLCLCSKNVEQDVFRVFDTHPDMLLTRDRLVGWRINWNAKSQNLRELAAELNLGLDSFVFLDDNPVECAEVRAHAPEVLTLQLPADEAKIPAFLRNIWALDQLTISEQDRKRTRQYQQSAKRESVRRESAGLADFLARLQLEVDIHPVADAEMARASDLTHRTNQFNASTLRRSETELRQLLRDGSHRCEGVRVKDRFGDYGLVGVMILRVPHAGEPSSAALTIDTLLLSCRVLGRGVEHQMIAHAGKIAREQNLGRVDLPFVPSARNKPMLNFLQSIGSPYRLAQSDGGATYQIPTDVAATLQAQVAAAPIVQEPADAPALVEQDGARPTEPLGRDEAHALYERIAIELNDPAAILEAIESKARALRGPVIPARTHTEPRNEDERKMLAIWREVLDLEQIGVNDDFFELGGTSLNAVDVILQVENVFGKRIPLASLMQAPTIELLARSLSSGLEDDSGLAMVMLRHGTRQPPLFMLPGVAGHVMAYREFAQLLQIDHPVIGMEMRPELEHNRKARSLEQITAEFVGRMTKIYPSGPFLLAGWSFGGRLAIEASLQLTAAGREVSMVLLFDTYGPGFPRALAPRERVMAHVKNVITLPPAKKLAYLGSRVLASGRLIRHQSRKLAVGPEANFHAYEDPHTREMVAINHAASQAYVPKPFPVKITLIRAERPVPDGMGLRVGVSYDDRYNGWRPFAARGIDLIPLDASHLGLFEQPAVSLVADAVTKIVKSAIPLAIPAEGA